MKHEVFFDIETQRLFADIDPNKIQDLGVSIVCVYSRTVDENGREIEGKMESFWENDFSPMWPIFQRADRVIGFNSKYFDAVVLQPYAFFNLSALPHFDIMDKFKEKAGHRISLNSLVTDTLGSAKSDVGSNAVVYWREHTPESLEKLQKYCEMDVALTRDLYDYVMSHKHVKYTDKWNTQRTLDLDFSYPADLQPQAKQIGLF
ncbi:hypothetical protein HGA91_03835 [candidate division WWE3 bacterium]|nr:hypothetical protein [candidate division WWE3 bacterium]